MACCCDFRFMRADRGFFCFKIDISIPFCRAYARHREEGLPITSSRKRPSAANATGRRLEAHHVLVKACADSEALLAESIAFGMTFNKKRPIYGEMKKRFHKEIIRTIDTEDAAYIEPLALMM